MVSFRIKSVSIVILCFIFLSSLVSCGVPDYELVDFKGQFDHIGVSIEPQVITSTTALDDLFDGYEIEWDDNMPISSRYGDDYFKDKVLIIYCFTVSGDYEPYVKLQDLQVENEKINVIIQQEPLTQGLAVFQKNILIEVTRSYIGNLNKVEVTKNYE